MQSLDFIQWAAALSYLLFIAAFGAICGSFINVLAYRLPRGMNIVVPPSACPHCGTKLTWRENFPIFGWLWLRGKCRFCKSSISPEYPIVEAIVALVFALVFALWFMYPSVLTPLGIDVGYWKPEWALAGMWRMWPVFFAVLALIGSFVAATIIDAKTFTIPIAIPWFATAIGFIAHPLAAARISQNRSPLFAGHDWAIPLAHGPLLGLAIGGIAGIGIAIVLLRLNILPLSFADYEEWEKAHIQDVTQQAEPADDASTGDQIPMSVVFRRVLFLTGPALTLMFLGYAAGMQIGKPIPLMTIGLAIGLLIGLPLRRLAEPSRDGDASEEPIWSFYPHIRREMVKEMLFLTPCALLAALGMWLTRDGGPLEGAAASAPLWLRALGGSILGYLAGGGLIWGIRIAGSLAFGKEAMGLGDVHLMAAAGAVLGWIDPTLAFFTAPFLGLSWAALSLLSSSIFKRAGTAMPYGPHLATATLLVLLLKPLFEWGLTNIFNQPIDIP